MVKLAQPGGAAIQARLWGDEFYRVIESLGGYTLVQDPQTRALCYAPLSADKTELVSTGIPVGEGDPRALGLTPHLRISDVARRSLISQARAEAERQKQDALTQALEFRRKMAFSGKPLRPMAAPTTGNVKGFCLLIDFSDDSATVPISQLDALLNQPHYKQTSNYGSVRDYFYDVSDGKLTLTHDLPAAYYRAPYDKSYYEADRSHSRLRTLFTTALDDLRAQGKLNLAQYDGNGDGIVDDFCCLYAGNHNYGTISGLWQHSWGFSYTGDGVAIKSYAIAPIENRFIIGTFCHETGHNLLGWPDLYDMNYFSSGIGNTCLMSYGCNNGGGITPAEPCAYLKMIAGWVNVVTLASPKTGLVVPAGVNTIYQYPHPTKSNEYYLVENRQQSGWDGQLYDSGLAVWHIDTLGNNANYQMTPAYHYQVTLVQADGRWDMEKGENQGDSDDLLDAGSVSTLHDATTPNTHWWDGSESRFEVSHVGSSGPSMTFDFGEPSSPSVSPRAGASFQGPRGGPFLPAAQTYTLTNRSASALAWTTSQTAWISVSQSSGTLAPGTSTTLTVTPGAAAAGLPEGQYRGALSFLDQADGTGPRRDVVLNIRAVSFKWDKISSPQTVNAPFGVRIAAVDAQGTTVTQFARPVRLGAELPFTIGSGSASQYYPISTAYKAMRTQVIYTAAELGGPARLTSLALNLAGSSYYASTLSNWTIRIKHTSLASFIGAEVWDNSGWTTVLSQGRADLPANADWVKFKFTTPFDYNGAGNLMVDFSFQAPEGYSSVTCNAFAVSAPRVCYGGYTTSNGGNSNLDPLLWSGVIPYVFSSSKVPNIRFFRSLPMTPAVATGFTSGTWSGQVSLAAEGRGVTLRADDDNFHTGDSAPFDVRHPLQLDPDGTLTVGGPAGGMFAPSPFTYTLFNRDQIPLTWSARKSAAWLALDKTGGTLPPGTSTTLTLRVTAAAEALALGQYADTVIVTDAGRGVEQSRPVTLEVRPLAGYRFVPIESPQSVHNPIPVRIAAVDALGTTATRYTDSAQLSAVLTGSGGSTVLPGWPVSAGPFVGGIWNGNVNFGDEMSGVQLQASGAGGLAGASNSFNITEPFVKRVTSPQADGVYTVGQAIDINVVFAAAVDYGGATPTLQLETGTLDRTVACTGKAAPDTLRFRYVVGAGERAARLDCLSKVALSLNGGWLRDAATSAHNALLTLPAPGAPGSLGAGKAIAIDTAPPIPVLASSAPDPTNLSPIPVSVDFGKPVTGFTAGDLSVSGASLGAFSGSGASYRFNLTPARAGVVTVSIPAGAAQDVGGLSSLASVPFTRTYDNVPPVFSSFNSNPSQAWLGKAVGISVTASESLSSSPTLTVNGGSTFIYWHGGLSYSFAYVVADEDFEGPAMIAVTGADRLGNTGVTTNSTVLWIDTRGPVCIVSGPPSPVSQKPFTFTIAFHEPILSSLDANKIEVSGGTRGGLVARGDGKTYDLTVTPAFSSRGEVVCQVPAGVSMDALGNASAASNRANVWFDSDALSARLVRYLLGAGNESSSGLDLNTDGQVTVADLEWQARNGPPATPEAPSPADGARSVGTGVTLDWADSLRAQSYQVFLWKASQAQPANPTASGFSASAWKPATALASNTAYRWCVVAINGSQKRQGPVWTFTTK